MNWPDLVEQYQALRRPCSNDEDVRALKKLVQAKFRQSHDEERGWLVEALSSEERKWFAAFVVKSVGGPPNELFSAMLRAAVYEPNPSANRAFIEPCVRHFGVRAVAERLLRYLEVGSNFEKAGAANALYWAQEPLAWDRGARAFTVEHATPASRARWESLSDLRQRKRERYLREFVENDDIDVRRSLIPSLDLQKDAYPEGIRPLVERAVQIARSHADEYIRHRVDVQMGSGGPIHPLPPRSQPPPHA